MGISLVKQLLRRLALSTADMTDDLRTTIPSLVVAEGSIGSAVSACRSLNDLGVPVSVAVIGQGTEVIGRSKSCRNSAFVDAGDDGSMRARIVELARSAADAQGRVAILPLSDRALSLLAGLDPSEGLVLVGPPANVVQPLLNKVDALGIAEAAGIQVPAWVAVHADGAPPEIDHLRAPLIVRPATSTGGAAPSFKFFVGDTHELTKERIAELPRTDFPLVVQEFIDCDEDDVEFGMTWRSSDGRTTAVCTGRKVRASTRQGGVMAFGATADLPDVRAAATRFLDAAGHTGPGGVEFIRHDDGLWFIEFNPRLEAIHFLAAAAGMDFVQTSYLDAIGEPPGAALSQTDALGWVGTAWIQRVRDNPREVRTWISDSRAFHRGHVHRSALWSFRDPGPGLAMASNLVRAGMKRSTQRFTPDQSAGRPPQPEQA